ncbi:MAG: L-serine ammonia-lyase, iron-sulfur-dependent, subunit alpha [Lachnospiraceae bacterium]|nr:L-serine ammonia-lyase, iron-sulfur-dependent, subunit alpha [Lachnospiraceae bacterium]
MDQCLYEAYIDILKEELLPAMGCTEPIAVAYAAASARDALGRMPDRVALAVSGNIVKNVKSVVVPHTGGLRGLAASVAAGIVAGNAEKKLEVIAEVSPEQIADIAQFLEKVPCTVTESNSNCVFDIEVRVRAGEHSAACRIAGHHTNIVRIERDGEALLDTGYNDSTDDPHMVSGSSADAAHSGSGSSSEDAHPDSASVSDSARTCAGADRSLLSVEQIVNFADEVELSRVRDIITRQIEYNTAIAEEGLRNSYGAEIGRILLRSYGDSVQNRAKAMAAAGSDARMNGCELPVVINSGSGNQGMTASLPVIVYAKELGVSEETLYRALIVSNLVTIHLKTGIGRLSAYCGATSAGCGAGAGITYLYGGRCREISHTIVNAVAINSGVICDGAKASCAAKIASAVEAGLLGMQMYLHGSQFRDGDGIVTKGVENTIRNVGELAREGMKETDREIIHLMIQKL